MAGLNEYFRLNKHNNSEKQLCISLETAHPAKFPWRLRQIINIDPPLPASFNGIAEKEENYFQALKIITRVLKEFILKLLLIKI